MSLLITALQKAEKSRNESGGRRVDDLDLEPIDSRDFASSERAYDPAQAATLLTAGERVSPLSDFVRDHSFGLVLGGLLLAGVGWGTYVWLQIQSPAMFAPKPSSPVGQNPPAIEPAPAAQPLSAIQPLAQSEPAFATPVQASPPQPEAKEVTSPIAASAVAAPIEEKPASAFEPAAKENRVAVAPERKAAPKEPTPREAKAAFAATPQPAQAINVTGAEREIQISRSVETPAEKSLVSKAYGAFQNGDYQAAKTLYEELRQAQPANTDVLLGLAAIAAIEGNSTEASQLYFKALELEPKNPAAQAGVISLLGRADPASSEVRLKSLIAKEPSANLYSVLGNLYAEQSKWAEAQSAYFQAQTLAQDNADYAFNLAVSLEHLSQPRPALTFYRKALELGGGRFDRAAVKARIVQLQSLEK
ncbi:MAG: tetratricopeptide repeat protein [Burkholderiales bacterium]